MEVDVYDDQIIKEFFDRKLHLDRELYVPADEFNTLKKRVELMEDRDHQLWLTTVSQFYEPDKIRDFIEKYYR